MAAVLATFHFATAETGSEEEGMAIAMRAFAMSTSGHVTRRPMKIILDCACQHFAVTLDELLGPTIKRHIARARRTTMWLLRANGYTWQEAAEAVGRNQHTDAMRACRIVDRDEGLLAEAAAVARLIADSLPEVKAAPVVWPRAATGSR
jgi:chromosomal replication initiation ATPase DnaA